MPGFLLSNYETTVDLKNLYDERCIQGEMKEKSLWIKRNTLNKFLNDKVFYKDADYSIVIDGAVLNKKHLCSQYGVDDFRQTIFNMYRQNGEEFFAEFRGSFSGLFYDYKDKKILVFTSHYGDNTVFFSEGGYKFAVGSQVNYLLDVLKANEVHIHLDDEAVLDMLTYGFMEDENTYAKEIKRVRPGSYLKICLNEQQEVVSLEEKRYYTLGQFREDLSSCSQDECMDRMNELFKKAIELEYDKDCEYGYSHLADLSGGLDSRMNVFVAHAMGYDDMTNVSYSLSGYLDETIPTQIANDLHNMLVFTPLDDAGFMLDIDKIVKMNYGLAMYSFITGGQRLLDNINTANYGIEHTGQLGDVVIGSYLSNANELKEYGRGGYSSARFLNKLNEYPIPKYENKELYMLSVRGMIGILASHIIRRNYVEVASPFINVEFLEYCLSIPVEWRTGHKMYAKWIKKYYPEAADYVWETTGLKPGCPEWIVQVKTFCKKCVMYFVRRSFLSKIIKEKGMNPMHVWYKEKPYIREYWDSFYKEAIEHPVIDVNIHKMLEEQYKKGNVVEKMQVLTVLSAIKLYFK